MVYDFQVVAAWSGGGGVFRWWLSGDGFRGFQVVVILW
jgi:hypothetical protein